MTASAAPVAVILTPHNAKEEWHQWVFLPGFRGAPITVKRTTNGRKHRQAWRDWVVLMCNNTDCPGQALIDSQRIADMVESALPVPVVEEARS